MANNNRIRLLRGTSSQIASSNKVLSYGQPLYNDDKNYITVGNSTGTKQVKAQPITVREVIGYYEDSTTISNSTSNQYKLSGDATNKTYINTPDAFNINVNNVNKVSIDGSAMTIKENVVVDSAHKITTPDIETSKLNGVATFDIFENDGTSITSTVKNAIYATYASQDTTKGTIEERLTSLGFRQGSFSIVDTSVVSPADAGTTQITITKNQIKRQGNYCVGSFSFYFSFTRNPDFSGSSFSVTNRATVTIPNEFKAKNETELSVIQEKAVASTYEIETLYIVSSSVNSFVIGGNQGGNGASHPLKLTNAGWEAQPI